MKSLFFTPPKHSLDLCISQPVWEFLCHTLYLKKYPFLLGPKGCGKSSVAMELADAMGMEFHAFDMGQAFKPKKMFLGGLVIGDNGKTVAVRSEFFNAFIEQDLEEYYDEMNGIGYRPFTIEEFLIEMQENGYLFASTPQYVLWASRKLKL